MDASPQWRGRELWASTLDLIELDGDTRTVARMLFPVLNLDPNFCTLAGNVSARLWQLALVAGARFWGASTNVIARPLCHNGLQGRVPAQRCARLLADAPRASLREGPSWSSASAVVAPTRHRLSKLAPHMRLLVAIRAVPVFLFRRLTQCLRSNSESVVLGDLAHATRHSSSIQRRRRSPTNTLSHNMHILRSVGVPTKPDQLHFHYFTPIRSWFLRHAIPFVRSISALESASRLEWFEVEWSVSRWMRSTLFLVRCESLGTSSDGCRPSWCSRSVRRRQDSEFFSHGGGRRWLVCWRY